MPKILKKVHLKEEAEDLLVVLQKTASMRLATTKGTVEHEKDLLLGVSIFPAAMRPSSVKVRFHGTFNMGNYSSLQAAVEIEDFTLPHPEARQVLGEQLQQEALEMLSKGVKSAAMKLFNTDVDTTKGDENA